LISSAEIIRLSNSCNYRTANRNGYSYHNSTVRPIINHCAQDTHNKPLRLF